ncbi:hypothetical protein JOM56_004118 [Amanita muscaria]
MGDHRSLHSLDCKAALNWITCTAESERTNLSYSQYHYLATMSDPMKECLSACCALCCLCGAASLQSWAMAGEGYGSRNGNAGCCDSCCKKSFDDDDFDEQVKRDMAKASAANATIVAQPTVNKEKMAVNKE